MGETQVPGQDEAVQAFTERGHQLFTWWCQRLGKMGSFLPLPLPMSLVAHRERVGILLGRMPGELYLLTIAQQWAWEVVVLPISFDPIRVIMDGVSDAYPAHGGSLSSRHDALIKMHLVPEVPIPDDLAPYERLPLHLAGLLGCIDVNISFIFALQQWLRVYNSATPRKRAVEVLRQVVAERWKKFTLLQQILCVASARVLVPAEDLKRLASQLEMTSDGERDAALERLEMQKLDKRHRIGDAVWQSVAAVLKREVDILKI